MTKKEVQTIISQLWYEINNYNWYLYRAPSMEKDEFVKRAANRQAAVDGIRSVCVELGMTVTYTDHHGAHNVLYVSYKGDTYLLWCLEYRDEYKDSSYERFMRQVKAINPKYITSSFKKNPDYIG